MQFLTVYDEFGVDSDFPWMNVNYVLTDKI
jgi:hypothetical protein